MKRFWSGMIVALVLVVVAGCGGSAAPPTAAFGDTVITVGSSTPSELLDAGFTPKEYSIKLDEKTMSSKTFDSKGIEMKKGGKGYARISMMNDSNSDKAYKDCKIYSVYYNPQFQTLVYEDVLINGINFRGYTRDQVKDAMKDKKIHIENSDNIIFRDGKYDYKFEFQDDGIVGLIWVTMQFDKDYSDYWK